MPLWVAEANRLRRDLPLDVQETLTLHEEAGTTSDPAYEQAVRVFYDRHVCRVPWPDCGERTFAQMAEDPTPATVGALGDGSRHCLRVATKEPHGATRCASTRRDPEPAS